SGGNHDQTVRLVQRLLKRIESVLEEPDAGLWEYRGRERVHTFTLLLHWTGARIAQRLGELLGDSSMVERGDRIRQRASELIESAYDAEAGYYGESTTNSDPDASLFMMVNLGYLRADNPRALGH